MKARAIVLGVAVLAQGCQSGPPEVQSDQPQVQTNQLQVQSVQPQVQSDQPEIQSGQPDAPDVDGTTPPAQLTAVEGSRIGSQSDPDVGFSQIAGVEVGPDRRMYVAEFQDRHIRIYDAEGNLEKVIGRQGQGPGEFQTILRLGLLGDTVWVVDLNNGRITLVDRDGELVGTVPIRRVGGAFPATLRSDRTWVSGSLGSVAVSGPIDAAVSHEIPELLFDASGAFVDTLRSVEIVQAPAQAVIDGVSITRGALLLDDPIIRHEPGIRSVIVRRAIATSDAPSTFSVTSTSVNGDTVFDRSYEYQPIPVDDAYVDRVVESLLAGYQSRLGEDRIERALRSVLPSFHPPVAQVRFGEDGSLWLRRESDSGTEARYWILEADGTIRGIVTLPSADRIMWSGADEVVGMELDELGVPWLIRYRFQ